MRLLFVSDFLPNWNSGAEGTLLSIGDVLEKRGHKVTHLWKDTFPRLLPHPRLSDLFELPHGHLKCVSSALRASTFDVVILSQPYSYLVYEQLTVRYPKTLFLNRTHGWEDRMSESWRRLGWRETSRVERCLSDLASARLSKACERTVTAAHGIIAASNLCADYITTHYSQNKSPVTVIPYGVESHLFCDRTNQSSQKLLFAGQYLPRKGSKILEHVLPRIGETCRNAAVTFVVPEGQIEQVKAIYAPSFGKRLSVLSWMSRERLASVYKSHDILLFPSFFEGFGKVFLEGMAAGLCVVGFREGGLPGIATHGRDALMCDTGDVHAFRMLTELALGNAALRDEIGVRARETARRYTWERHAIETEKFCMRLKFGEVKAALAS